MRFGVALSITAGLFLLLGGFAAGADGPLAVREAPLHPAGEAYEINSDGAGMLLVSDYGADEIRRMNPLTGAYEAFGVAYPGDARRDASGRIWFTDAADVFASLDPTTGAVTSWSAGEDAEISLYGLAFDDSGRVWMTEWFGSSSSLHRFDPATNELCSYPLPGGVSSYYILYRDGAVWFSNWGNNRIYRFDITTEEAQHWQLAAGASPTGMDFEPSGNLWWADEGTDALVRLNPNTDQVTSYPVPNGGNPLMVAWLRGKIWYTDSGEGAVGVLDPSRAAGSTVTISPATESVTAACRNLGEGSSSTATVTTGVLAWTEGSWPQASTAGGWEVYQMPAGALPWGIAVHNGLPWVVDQGRRVLAHPESLPQERVLLPLILR